MPVFEVTVRVGLVGDDVDEDSVRSIIAMTLDSEAPYWARNIVNVQKIRFTPSCEFAGPEDDGTYRLIYNCEYGLEKLQPVPVADIYDRSRAQEIVLVLNAAEKRKWEDTYGEASV